jgi:hypothetical protein
MSLRGNPRPRFCYHGLRLARAVISLAFVFLAGHRCRAQEIGPRACVCAPAQCKPFPVRCSNDLGPAPVPLAKWQSRLFLITRDCLIKSCENERVCQW